ncbi:MAG: TonB-dependent receptor [Chloroflexota bacterium]
MRLFLIIFAILTLTAIDSTAANVSLSGFVRDSADGEPLIGANVVIVGAKYGARTNKSGFYAVANLPAGKYKVVVSFLGYERYTTEITIPADHSLRKDFALKSGSVETEEVYVDAEREVEKREITISKVNVPVETIREIRIGGESDVFRSLQFLPGILTSSQISSGLFVRGGSPDQNLVLLDGSTVYNPTHLFGFISTFNADAVKDVELYRGGFQAEYGGRLSAALAIEQKEGDRSRIGGSASLGVISSRASLEGPLFNGSWFFGGRRTYFEIVKEFLPKDPKNPLPDFRFYDLNGKITQNFGENDKISTSGFLSSDKLTQASYGSSFTIEIGNRLAAASWTHIINGSIFLVSNFSYSSYFNSFTGDQGGYEFQLENSIADYTLKSQMEWFASDRQTYKFGFESSLYDFEFLQNFTGNRDSLINKGTNAQPPRIAVSDFNHSAFAQGNLRLTELFSVQAGLRASYWTLSQKFTLDPRLAVKDQLTENIAIKAAFGIYHQNLRLASQPDFSFFDTWLPTDSTMPASRAEHYILSLETTFLRDYDFNFDIYAKTMHNVSELNMNVLGATKVREVFYVGNARSWGAEIFVQKKSGKLTGWVGYALGFIESKFDSINYGRAFRPKYDRRHDFKIVAQYDFNEKFNVGANFTFQTGQSYTGAGSRFQSRFPGQNYGRGKIVQTQRYGLRLPPSHQLNVNAGYGFDYLGIDWRIILDVYNVYNRRDIWFRYYNVREDQTVVNDVLLLPILPTISIEAKF